MAKGVGSYERITWPRMPLSQFFFFFDNTNYSNPTLQYNIAQQCRVQFTPLVCIGMVNKKGKYVLLLCLR